MYNILVQPVFSVVQKAFIINSKWHVLITRLPQTGSAPVLYDLPGGRLEHQEGLRGSLSERIMAQTGLTITTVSAPLNVTTFLDWVDRSVQVVRIIYLCLAQGQLTPGIPGTEYIWIEPAKHQLYPFPDEGYQQAFTNYLSHSELASSEFLGAGILTDTITYLRTKSTSPLL